MRESYLIGAIIEREERCVAIKSNERERDRENGYMENKVVSILN